MPSTKRTINLREQAVRRATRNTERHMLRHARGGGWSERIRQEQQERFLKAQAVFKGRKLAGRKF